MASLETQSGTATAKLSQSPPKASSSKLTPTPAPQRNAPCQFCRRIRGRCSWLEGNDVCTTCESRSLPCSGPSRIKAMKCITCFNSKIKCSWLEVEGVQLCDACYKAGKACPGPRDASFFEQANGEVVTTTWAKPKEKAAHIGPSSTAARIFTTQLSLSLAWHCISVCCSYDHVSFGGGDPTLYMNYFHVTRQQSRNSLKPPWYEEVLTSLIIFCGATVSSHSAVTGTSSAPSFTSLLNPSRSSLKSSSSFPVLSSQRTSALDALSTTLAKHTSNYLESEQEDFASAVEQLGLVRLVLSKATAVDATWQAEICQAALQRSLERFSTCKASEKEALIPIVRNFAFKAIINSASTGHQGALPLTQSEFDIIFDPPNKFPKITPDEIEAYVYGDCTDSTFMKFIWYRSFRHIYNLIARVFFDLIKPNTTSTLQSIWEAVDEFRAYKTELFTNLLVCPDRVKGGRMGMRYSTVLRSLLAYEANYWKMAMIARSILGSNAEQESAVQQRWLEVIPGIAADVALLLSLPVLLTRKLEVLNHQIALLLKMPGEDLSRDFLVLSREHREALLQGVKLSAEAVKGSTAAHLDAIVDLLQATDLEVDQVDTYPLATPAELISSVHVTSAIIDVLRTSSSDQLTSLFVLVVVPFDG